MSGDRVRLCALADIEPDTSMRIDAGGYRVALIRIADDLFAIGDRCSHADFSLAEGELDIEGRTLECWKHGSTFSIDNGEPECLPAMKPVPVYDVVVEDDDDLRHSEPGQRPHLLQPG